MQKGVDGAKRRAEQLALNVLRTALTLQHSDPLIRLFVACVEEYEFDGEWGSTNSPSALLSTKSAKPKLNSSSSSSSSFKQAAANGSAREAMGAGAGVIDPEALHFLLAVLSAVLSSDVGIEYGEPSAFGGVRWVCVLRVRWVNRTFFRAFGHAMQLRMIHSITLCSSFVFCA
jgi:hypothetical protein